MTGRSVEELVAEEEQAAEEALSPLGETVLEVIDLEHARARLFEAKTET